MSYPYHVFDGWVVSMSLEIECIILVPQLSFLCKVLIRRYEKWGYLVVVWACFVALLAGVLPLSLALPGRHLDKATSEDHQPMFE